MEEDGNLKGGNCKCMKKWKRRKVSRGTRRLVSVEEVDKTEREIEGERENGNF